MHCASGVRVARCPHARCVSRACVGCFQPEVDVRSLDELMRKLDVEPYGVPVGKVVDAYPSASRDIEVRCHSLPVHI